MFKKVIIGSFIIIIVALETFLLSTKKSKEPGEVKITIPVQEKKEFYVSIVPKVEHEIVTELAVNTNVNTKPLVDISNENNNSINNNDVIEVSNEIDNVVKNEVYQVEKEETTLKPDAKDLEEPSEEENINLKPVVIENADETNEKEDKIINQDASLTVKETETKDEVIERPAILLKNGFINENNITYYYENDIKVTGIKNINGVNNYFSPSGKYLGTNNIKVIDVSYYQGIIDWDLFVSESDCYGVILRLGYFNTLDKMLERNIRELKRLNIPYGIYLFSYSTTLNGATKESDFTNEMIDKYDLKPSLGIYYDIESWNTKTSNSNSITKDMYDNIIQYYINSVSNHINYKYKVKVYSGRWYAMNRLGNISKKYVDWVAEYNKTCKYDEPYSMWQYTSKGSIPGINGNVDINYLY